MTIDPHEQPVADEQAVIERTVRGVGNWLYVAIALFWLAVAGVVAGMLQEAPQIMLTAYFGFLAVMVITLLAYLFVLIDPVLITRRYVQIPLAISFADFHLFSVIMSVVGGLTWPLLVLKGVLLLASAVMLALALLRGQRLLFALAFALLLGANLLNVVTR